MQCLEFGYNVEADLAGRAEVDDGRPVHVELASGPPLAQEPARELLEGRIPRPVSAARLGTLQIF